MYTAHDKITTVSETTKLSLTNQHGSCLKFGDMKCYALLHSRMAFFILQFFHSFIHCSKKVQQININSGVKSPEIEPISNQRSRIKGR